MGGSAKWIKSLMGLKKSEKDHNHQEGKKWKLWRNSSESRSRQSEATSETVSVTATPDPLAALVRAPPRDFETVQKEWAAVRIQSAFRSFLARRALKALKGIVRIQALVRGRRVRKDLAVTYKCMQALVRVQEKFRQRRLDASSETSQPENNLTDPVKLAEDGWCDKQGSIDEIKAKIKMRHEGAIKRERALSYASSQKQQLRVMTPNRKSSSLKNQEIDFSKPNSFQIRRNNISTRISLKPPAKDNISFSDFYERSPSSSSPVGFNFMSLTESTKAKMSETKKKALKNVNYEKNESGSHLSVSGNNKSGLRLMRCDNNNENWSFEPRMSPFA